MPTYTDLSGAMLDRPAASPPRWRVSCYPVVVRGDRILMVEPVWASRWELPGGGVELEREETLVEAAARECREETGYGVTLDPTSLHFLREDFFSVTASGNYYHSLLFTVLGRVAEDPSPGWLPDPDEIRRIAWVDPRTLSNDDVHMPHWQALIHHGICSAEQ